MTQLKLNEPGLFLIGSLSSGLHRARFGLFCFLLFGLAVLMQGCFTGVEGTKKITLSKHDMQQLAPTEEEKLFSSIQFQPVGEWRPGKKLLVNDDKINLIIESADNDRLKAGDTLLYSSTEERISPDGTKKSRLVFSRDGKEYIYPLDKSPEDAKENVTTLDLNMLTDIGVVNDIAELLNGKRLWTRTNLWYDENMNYVGGRKFYPVTIEEVTSGNSFFPVKVTFTTAEGKSYSLLMNFGNSGNETRGFAKLFYLSDPKKDYKNISPENWEAIQLGRVRNGMTKEECRLSLGNPSDINTGHDYSRAYEIWYYPDGTSLRFADDMLVSFRK